MHLDANVVVVTDRVVFGGAYRRKSSLPSTWSAGPPRIQMSPWTIEKSSAMAFLRKAESPFTKASSMAV
jgi:hypothetical protein